MGEYSLEQLERCTYDLINKTFSESRKPFSQNKKDAQMALAYEVFATARACKFWDSPIEVAAFFDEVNEWLTVQCDLSKQLHSFEARRHPASFFSEAQARIPDVVKAKAQEIMLQKSRGASIGFKQLHGKPFELHHTSLKLEVSELRTTGITGP